LILRPRTACADRRRRAHEQAKNSHPPPYREHVNLRGPSELTVVQAF
jgi:hypothetical protein